MKPMAVAGGQEAARGAAPPRQPRGRSVRAGPARREHAGHGRLRRGGTDPAAAGARRRVHHDAHLVGPIRRRGALPRARCRHLSHEAASSSRIARGDLIARSTARSPTRASERIGAGRAATRSEPMRGPARRRQPRSTRRSPSGLLTKRGHYVSSWPTGAKRWTLWNATPSTSC